MYICLGVGVGCIHVCVFVWVVVNVWVCTYVVRAFLQLMHIKKLLLPQPTRRTGPHTFRDHQEIPILLTQHCTHQEIPILIDTVLYTPRDPYPYWHSTVHTKRSLSLLTQYCTHQEIPVLIDTVLYTPRDPYPYWHSTVHTKRSLSLLTQYCTPRDPYPYWHSTVHTKRSLSLLTQ